MKSTLDYLKLQIQMNDSEISVIATETNMWSPDLLGSLSNDLIYVIAGVIVIVAAIATAIVLRRKRPSFPQQSPSSEVTQTSTRIRNKNN